MKTIHIIYRNYLNANKSDISVGGIQTYIYNLSCIFSQEGYKVTIHQIAEESFKTNHKDIVVYGYSIKSKRGLPELLWKECSKKIDKKNELVIFGSEEYAVKNNHCYKSIAIQHGIYWDKPHKEHQSKYPQFLNQIKKDIKNKLIAKKPKYAKTLVCVDYNYINWYRALIVHRKIKPVIIPNFTKIAPNDYKNCKETKKIKIIFARRFYEYRGTRIFAEATKRLLNEYTNIEVTLAGEGPEEHWLKKELACFDNVNFIKYITDDSLKVHKDKNIAVIPTTGSEGTSLSLLEAMSAQCAVICTNVGGMTNIVIDHYNGIMINPDEESVYQAMKILIEDERLRKKLSKRAYETVMEGFSYELWEKRWIEVLQDFE